MSAPGQNHDDYDAFGQLARHVRKRDIPRVMGYLVFGGASLILLRQFNLVHSGDLELLVVFILSLLGGLAIRLVGNPASDGLLKSVFSFTTAGSAATIMLVHAWPILSNFVTKRDSAGTGPAPTHSSRASAHTAALATHPDRRHAVAVNDFTPLALIDPLPYDAHAPQVQLEPRQYMPLPVYHGAPLPAYDAAPTPAYFVPQPPRPVYSSPRSRMQRARWMWR